MSEIIEILDKKGLNSEVLNNVFDKITSMSIEDLSKEIPSILSKLGTLMQKDDGAQFSESMLKNLPKMMEKILSDKEVKYELSLTADMAFNLKINNNAVGIQIKEGNLSVSSELEQPEFFIEVPTSILAKIFTEEANLMEELMAGERVKLWREREPYNAQKLLELIPLLSLILEKLNLDKWM